MRTSILFLAIVLLLPVITCNGQSTKETAPSRKTGKVEAYYFHFNARCITCKTVEAEAKAAIEALYPELIKSGKVTFKAVNLDEPSSKALADKLGINGQTLLLVNGTQKIDITNEGFMYARSNPEKLKTIIKERIDKLLL